MAINLKQVLDGSEGQIELSSILSRNTAIIKEDLAKKRTSADLIKLETWLNSIFYPVGSTPISVDYYNQRLSKSTEDQLIEVFNNFDFESNKSGYYSAKTAISPETLRKTMMGASQNLKTLLEQISNTPPSANLQHLLVLEKQLKKLIKQAYVILSTAERSLQFGEERITGQDFEKALPIINQLTAFSKALAIPNFVSPQEAGVLFEKALALTNYVENVSNDVIDEALREIALSTSHHGSETISRGYAGPVSYSVNAKVMDQERAKDLGFKISQGNATYTYSYNPSSKKQGKMDVQLTFPGGGMEDYRVSAKRWTKGFGDLGETSIDAGISRAAGQSVAEAYKFAVLTPKEDWANSETPSYIAASSAHEFAKFALKTDIAMGLNQGVQSSGAGYANTLVIDTGSQIKVLDLATIVQEAELYNYNDSAVEGEANRAYKALSQITTGRTESYLGLMTSVLNKMKVTIKVSV